MVTHLVAPGSDSLYLFRVLISPEAAEEECGVNVVFIQCVQDEIRFVGFPCCIDSQRDLLVASLHAVDGKLAFFAGQYLKLVFLHVAEAVGGCGVGGEAQKQYYNGNEQEKNDGDDYQCSLCQNQYLHLEKTPPIWRFLYSVVKYMLKIRYFYLCKTFFEN